ncbi:peptidase inhibitor family I36 protein [Streptomyces sp. NPDC087294]|uniref:peptidase inhibitor family I36 protein n=1 Tax=Streptomyces sp. NPDC087294 TaxID=3365777 RepID=UPI0038274B20
MKRFMKKVGLASALVMAGAGLAALPTATAQAAAPYPVCPRVTAVCTWTEPSFEGEMRILFNGKELLQPPVRSALNQSFDTWCFYERPFFDNRGQMREVNRGEEVHDFGFPAHSAREGQCHWDS